MLQHQVSNIFFFKLFGGTSYFLFVRCIQLLLVIVPNPSLQTFLISVALTDHKRESGVSDLSRQH